MRNIVFFFCVLLLPLSASARVVRDTLTTLQNDQIIIKYDISVNDESVIIRLDNKPRIIPSDRLRKACKGNLDLLKVVVFDRVGDFGKVKWKGISPTAFMVPSGLSYDKSSDGFYILGESTLPMSFTKKGIDKRVISFPLYIAVYEKKQTYKLVSSTIKPLKISIAKTSSVTTRRVVRTGIETERIAVQTSEVVEADNDEITMALSCMQRIRLALTSQTEFPFSQDLQMEIYRLRSLQDRIKDSDIIEKINEVLLLCNEKERELKESQKDAALSALAQEKALQAQQKAEEDAQKKEAEEKARIQEEKQQKRSLWMIIGGVILAVLGFIGNTIFRHFRDVRNQKSIMEMQNTIAKQAEHEASRRSREIIRNKAHQVVNKGKSKMRVSLNEAGKKKKNTNTKTKSI